MKNYLYKATIGLILILGVMACKKKDTQVILSDNITSEFIGLARFNELMVTAAFDVEINFSDTNKPVEIIANENLHPYIVVVKSYEKLMVGLQSDISIVGPAQLKVVLHTAYLTRYTANEASTIRLMDTLKTDQVTINLTGASNMSGAIITESLSADIREASLLDISGKTADFSLYASRASRMSSYSFTCENLDADLSGASEAELTVNGKINIKASGASALRYQGDATIESQDLKDASTINLNQINFTT
jgi:hypothetical protein